jgi:hypothetical protein
MGITYFPPPAITHVSGLWAPSTTFPTAPIEGELFYETDTDKLWVYDGADWVELSRAGIWTNFTPVLSQGASTDISKTVAYSRWTRFGRTIIYAFRLTASGAGTAGAAIGVSVPFARAAQGYQVGPGQIYDTSISYRYGESWEFATSTVINLSGAESGGGAIGAAPSFAVATGDQMRGTIIYEAAAST